MAMHDKQAPSRGRRVHIILHDADIAISAGEVQAEQVVVAGDENYGRAFTCLAQQLLQNVAVLLRPMTRFAQLPQVDEVAYDIKLVEIGDAKKLEYCSCAASTGSQ